MTFLESIKGDFTSSDIKTIFEDLQTILKYFADGDPVYHKNGVLFIGRSGAGKSTLIASLLGANLIKKQNEVGEDCWTLTRPDKLSRKYPAIGETDSSETAKCKSYHFGTDLLLIDTPGLDDNRGAFMRQRALLSISVAVQQIRDIQGIVLACPLSDIQDKALGFINQLETIAAAFPDADNMDEKPFFLVFTKFDPTISISVSSQLFKLLEMVTEQLSKATIDSERAKLHRICAWLTWFCNHEEYIFLIHPEKKQEIAEFMEGIQAPIKCKMKKYFNQSAFVEKNLQKMINALINGWLLLKEQIAALEENVALNKQRQQILFMEFSAEEKKNESKSKLLEWELGQCQAHRMSGSGLNLLVFQQYITLTMMGMQLQLGRDLVLGMAEQGPSPTGKFGMNPKGGSWGMPMQPPHIQVQFEESLKENMAKMTVDIEILHNQSQHLLSRLANTHGLTPLRDLESRVIMDIAELKDKSIKLKQEMDTLAQKIHEDESALEEKKKLLEDAQKIGLPYVLFLLIQYSGFGLLSKEERKNLSVTLTDSLMLEEPYSSFPGLMFSQIKSYLPVPSMTKQFGKSLKF